MKLRPSFKICFCLLLLVLLAGNLCAQNTRPSAADYFITIGEELIIETGGVIVLNLFANKPSGMNFSDIWESLTSPYVWDTSSFVRNQVVHPLAGSFFYNAARANNFSFWGGFAYTAVSSWVWENLFENSSTSINDLITTTTAGCVTGEVLHRLGYEVSRFWNPLMWLLSPVDAANYLIKNPDKAFKPNDEIESGIYFFEAGIGGSLFINPENLAELGGDMNSSLFLIYEEPFDHKTKEPFDQFTLDAQVYTDFSSCFAFAEFEGHLYSWPFFQNTNLPSSIGISMNYKVNYSNDFNYSTNALGSFLCQKVPLGEESYFSWNLEANFIFLEASKVAKKNYYNFGPEAKLTLMVESRYVNFRCFSEFDYVFMQWIYHSKNFASIDFKILKNWSIGISDLFWCINGESFYNFISISTKMIL